MLSFLTTPVPMWLFIALSIVFIQGIRTSLSDLEKKNSELGEWVPWLRRSIHEINEKLDEKAQTGPVPPPFGDIRDRH